MGQYSSGTVSVTTGSQLVTLTGGVTTNNISVGDIFQIIVNGLSTGVAYPIGSIVSATQFNLVSNFLGTTNAAANYRVSVDFTPVRGLSLIGAGDLGTDVLWNRNMGIIDAITGGAGGTLNSLTDVNVTGVTDGQGLIYQTSTSTWVPATLSGGTPVPLATASVNGLLSSGDFVKLGGIATGAEVNVQADWNETNTGSDAFILNKPTIPPGSTTEDIQDIVGAMVSGNTETNISVTYDDVGGKLNFDVTGGGGNVAVNDEGSQVVATATTLNFVGTGVTASAGGGGTATITIPGDTGQLTTEEVQDIVGAMVSGNTETGISVTYQDSDGTIDFSVDSQTDENFTSTLLAKLNGIATGAEVNVQSDWDAVAGDAFILNKPTIPTPRTDEEIQDIIGAMVSDNTETNISVTYDDPSGKLNFVATDTNTQLSDEEVQDIVGAMFSGNTETGVTITYQDSDGTIDVAVVSQTDENFTTALQTKLNGIATGAEVNVQSDWDETDTGNDAFILNKPTIPTPRTDEEIQDVMGTALTAGTLTGLSITYQDSTNDFDISIDSQTDENFTTVLQTKLNGIATGAEVNVQSDWNETDTGNDAFILNKPTLVSTVDSLTDVTAPAPQDGQVLTYFTAFSDWRPSTPGSIPGAGGGSASGIDISQNTFRIAAALGLDAAQDSEFLVDTYVSSSGVDLSASTNELYNATGDYFTGTVDVGALTDLVPDMTSNTAPSGTVSSDGIVSPSNAFSVFDDDSTTFISMLNSVPDTGEDSRYVQYEFVSAQTVVGFSLQNSSGATGTGPSEVTIRGSNDGSTWTALHTETFAVWDTTGEKRVVTFTNDTEYTHYRLNLVQPAPGASVLHVAEIELLGSAALPRNALTLQSNASTTAAQSDSVNIVIWHEDVVADATLNTDLIVAVSRDNGTTFTNAVLSEFQRVGQFRTSTAVVDVSSQPAGTQLKYRITAAAGGEIRIHGMALDWAVNTNTQLTTEEVQDIVGAMVSGNTETNIAVTYDDTNGKLDFVSTDTNTQLSTEQVQDIVGAMVSGNTETGITVTYEDSDGTLDFVVTGGGGGGDIAVQEEGTQVLAAATAINFVGHGVTASDGGSGVATVTIPGVTALAGLSAVRNWSPIPIQSETWRDIVWSPELGIFVALGETGTRVSTSAEGEFWTARTVPSNINWKSVAWGAGASLFAAVAFAGAGNRIMTSPDGINWTLRTHPVANSWQSITWSESLSLFCAVSIDGTGDRVMTSPDGITWTSRTNSSIANFLGVTWAEGLGLFIAVGFAQGDFVMTSPDGINWTSRTAADTDSYESVAYSDDLGLAVAVASGGTGTRLMTSPDGINWTSRTPPVTAVWTDVRWASGLQQFIVIGISGALMTSPDGINWTSRRAAEDNGWLAIEYCPEQNLAVAVSSTGTNRAMRTL